MADKNIQVMWKEGMFEAKLESLSGKAEPRKINGKEILMKSDGTPEIFRKNSKGEPLTFCRSENGVALVNANGESKELNNSYINPKGEICADVIPYFQDIDGNFIEAQKNNKTEIFEIKKWEPLSAFTDKYIVDKYYQVKPSQGKSKKDFQRLIASNGNTAGMKKIWDYMMTNQVVGRGILNITSAGYLPTIAYLRPVKIEPNNWTIEIGTFKQQKRFTWLEEMNFKPREVEKEVGVANVPSIDEI